MSVEARSSVQSIERGWVALAGLVLLIALFYTMAHVFATPYPGVDFDSRWTVLAFDDPCETDPKWCARRAASLEIGDRMLVIGDLTFEDYGSLSTGIPFWPAKSGDVVPITYERDGEMRKTDWVILGPTSAARSARLMGLLTYLPFWLAGTGMLLFIRPRDQRWRLLVAFNYLITLWIAAGIPSVYRLAGSAVLLLSLTCLLLPVFLHLHLLVPAPILERYHRFLVAPLYLIALIFVVITLVGSVRGVVYGMMQLLAIVGSLLLLLARLFRSEPPSVRLALRLMLAGIGLSFGPAVVLYLIPGLINSSIAGRVPIIFMTVAISLLPFFYIYALYKHRFGALEFRANRVLSLFSFLVVYLTLFMFVFVLGSRWVEMPTEAMAFSFVLSVVFVAAGMPLRTPFQRLVDRLAYGTVHRPDDIIRAFADEIPRALSQDELAGLLTSEVMPSLLIRQSALYLVRGNDVTLYYAEGVSADEQASSASNVRELLAATGRFRPPEPGDESAFSWVRLPVAIEVGGTVVGVWLLGKRDPDDFYPKRDIDLLLTLANQVGVALETSRSLRRLEDQAAELRLAYSELQVLDRLKDEFVQNISHELRTPLTIVRGLSELLSEGAMGDLVDAQQETLAQITERTDGVIRMVNDIINIQRAASERLEMESVDVGALVRSCVSAAEMVAGRVQNAHAGHTFSVVVSGEMPPVWGDRRRLRQVVDNLMDNAVKFSPQGGAISVQVAQYRHRLDGQGAEPLPAVEIRVSDQGVGISADKLDRIWERFYQVDGSSTRQFGGLGLGLAIVQAIVGAHGGKIWAESVEGQGSTFFVVLPAAVGKTAHLESREQLLRDSLRWVGVATDVDRPR